MRIACDWRFVPRRHFPIDTHVARKMGTGIGTCSARNVLLFGLTVSCTWFCCFADLVSNQIEECHTISERMFQPKVQLETIREIVWHSKLRAIIHGVVEMFNRFGTVIMLSVSGVLASSSMGWPSVFYFSGAFSVLWAILWLFFGSSSPAENKMISAAERDYIQSSLGHVEDDPECSEKAHRKTPWGDILTSLPFISLMIVHCAQNYGFWMLLTWVRVFLIKIRHSHWLCRR